jgi:Ca2+-binding EF-hand superfamily protein
MFGKRNRSKSKERIGTGPEDSRYVKEVNIYSEKVFMEGALSKEIKVMAEVEKIWIVYDVDKNGTLDSNEVNKYLRAKAYPNLKLSEKQIGKLFAIIDTNGDGKVDKNEMKKFVRSLMEKNNTLPDTIREETAEQWEDDQLDMLDQIDSKADNQSKFDQFNSFARYGTFDKLTPGNDHQEIDDMFYGFDNKTNMDTMSYTKSTKSKY